MAKKPAKMSPTRRTLKWLRDCDYTVAITERWNPHARIRQDLFGCIDVLAISKEGHGCIGIQATTGGHVSHRLAKILDLPAAKVWVEAGNKLWVVGWRLLKKSKRWEPIIHDVLIGEFADTKE